MSQRTFPRALRAWLVLLAVLPLCFPTALSEEAHAARPAGDVPAARHPRPSFFEKAAPHPARGADGRPRAPYHRPPAALLRQTPGNEFIISEFRLSGPAGPADEFIELYNNTDGALTVATTDGSAGWALVSSEGLVRFVIPAGTVIPARRHYLAAGSTYSLGAHAEADKVYAAEIPDNTGIALFRTAAPTNFTLENRLDAVGPAGEANALFKEGTGYPNLTAFDLQHCFYRNYNLVTGQPTDTGNNAADFLFVDTNGTSAGAGQRLGAPGPENLASPVVSMSTIGVGLLDSTVGSGSAPNRVRDFTSDPANNAPFGTLSVRRRIINNTGEPLIRLRFRVISLTTYPPPPGLADLRPMSSKAFTVMVNDASQCAPSAPPCQVPVQGTILEQPPQQPNGGGYNSTFAVGVITLPSPLPPGGSINIQFLHGLSQLGTFRFYINIEALKAPPNVPPSVELTQPTPGSLHVAPASITLTATADDSDGTVSKVEFFRDGAVKIGEATAPPYNYVWEDVGAGTYSLSARATDNSGASSTSGAVTVTVVEDNGVTPVITGLTPASGPVGTQVTIAGRNFGAQRGSSTVTFNGVAAGFGTPPPQPGKIAFASDRDNADGNYDVYSMAANGSAPSKLAGSPSNESTPVWSPDGSRIAYIVCNTSWVCDISVMNADGSNQTPLVTNPADDWNQKWSPDGTKLAFLSDRAGTYELFKINADGTGLAQLTNLGGYVGGIDWSPDGQKMVFDYYAPGADFGEVYVVNADGTGLVNITSSPEEDEYAPRWSPDGTKIVYESYRYDTDYNRIYLMNADGSNRRPLTPTDTYETAPAWSPDSSRLVFISELGGNTGVYSINADGSGMAVLALDRIADRPKWSPDGTAVIYTTFDLNGQGRNELMVMNADGSGLVNLTNNPAADIAPNWQPLSSPAPPTSWSSTSIAVQVPPGATTGPVVVRVNGVASNGVTFTVTAPGDTDGDGLPDAWEMQYFGNLGQGADGDPDGDGLTNLQEYRLGRNPTKGALADGTLINLKIYTPLERTQ